MYFGIYPLLRPGWVDWSIALPPCLGGGGVNHPPVEGRSLVGRPVRLGLTDSGPPPGVPNFPAWARAPRIDKHPQAELEKHGSNRVSVPVIQLMSWSFRKFEGCGFRVTHTHTYAGR